MFIKSIKLVKNFNGEFSFKSSVEPKKILKNGIISDKPINSKK